MGCCFSSKLPTFPPSSAADGIAPTSPPHEFDSKLVKFIPQPGMFGNAVGVYIDNYDTPTYFFAPTGGSYKLFKIEMEDKKEVAVIKSGWQRSDGYDQTDTMGNSYGNVTTSATKTLTVVTKPEGGMEHKVKIVKTFQKDSGTTVEIDEGYSTQENIAANQSQPRLELSLHGDTIAHVYEKRTMGSGSGGISGAINDAMAQLKAPMALYIKRSLSETEFERALTIIATVSDRLLRIASLDINDGGAYNSNYDHHHYDHYNHNHNNYDNDGGGDYGGDGGDFGGGE